MLIFKGLQNDMSGHNLESSKIVSLAEKIWSILKSFVEEKRTKGMAKCGVLKNLSKKSLCSSFWGEMGEKLSGKNA